MPKRYSTAIAVNTFLVQNWEQELSFPYFSVTWFLESHNCYLTMVFIYLSWRINILQMVFLISTWLEIFLFSTRVEANFSPGWNFNLGWISTRVHVTAPLFFSMQLGSYPSPQNCLYFQGFWGLKLFNGCLAVWPNDLCLRRMQ